MAVAELSLKEQRYKRNDKVFKKFSDYLEKRRYPQLTLIARDADINYTRLLNFKNGKVKLSNANLDRLETFMKDN